MFDALDCGHVNISEELKFIFTLSILNVDLHKVGFIENIQISS